MSMKTATKPLEIEVIEVKSLIEGKTLDLGMLTVTVKGIPWSVKGVLEAEFARNEFLDEDGKVRQSLRTALHTGKVNTTLQKAFMFATELVYANDKEIRDAVEYALEYARKKGLKVSPGDIEDAVRSLKHPKTFSMLLPALQEAMKILVRKERLADTPE